MFLVGGAILVLVVAMLGKLSADRLKRRIARINRTLSHPDELASMPELPRRARDEIDELAANSAQVILRVRNLLEAHSDTTDRLAHEIRTPLTRSTVSRKEPWPRSCCRPDDMRKPSNLLEVHSTS